MVTHNLPAQTTAFVGRTHELAEIAALLAEPACRLLTLVGPGGIGKTRLALEAAQSLISPALISPSPLAGMGQGVGSDSPPHRHGEGQGVGFPNGVYFVPLQPLTSPDFIVSTIANAVNFQFYAGGEPQQQLLDFFREKQVLLLLDNFEHLLDGVSIISDLLAYAPQAKMFTTSRERLNLSSETVFSVSGMDFPDWETPEDALDYSAVKLFMQSARRVRPQFTLAVDDLKYLARICRLVGGMPLAILLAAAWVEMLTLEQIAAEISRSLDFLETELRDMPERQRSIRATFDYSWKRLSDTERDVFKKLSVFRGGFTREAAQAIAGASLKTLVALVTKSLVRAEASGRYDLHELLRQYAEEQLNIMPEEREPIRDLHSAYYAEFMHRQAEHLRTHRQRAALDDIEADIDNVRAAWRCMVEKRKAAEIRKSAYNLAVFLEWHNWFQEGLDLFGQAVEALRAASADKEIEIVRGLVLALQAWFFNDVSDARTAKALTEESLSIMRRFDSPEGMMVALDSLASASWFLNQLTELKQVAQEGLSIARKSGDLWWEAVFLLHAGETAWKDHDYAEARQMLGRGIAIFERFGAPWGIASVCRLLGEVAYDLGDYSEAKRLHEQALRLSQEIGHVWGIAVGYMFLARVATSVKDFAQARRYFWHELEIDLNVGTARWQTDTLVNITRLLVAQDEKERAVELLALVHQHPATMQYNRDEAEQRLAELQAELAPDGFAAAVERGRSRDLQTTIKELIADFSQPVQDAAQLAASEVRQALLDSLSERELEILRLIAGGRTNREIADELVLALGTVKWYISEIYSKLQVNSRTQAIARARELELLT